MLSTDLQIMIFNLIPNTITIDGVEYQIQKSLGDTPLNNVVSPTLNLTFVNNNTLYYQSFDGCPTLIADTTHQEEDIRAVLLRYKVGATDIVSTNTKVYKIGTDTSYPINGPAIKINSITSGSTTYPPTAYKLDSTRTSISWTEPPALGTEFTINYDYISSGYYIANKVMEWVIEQFYTLRQTLNVHDIKILEISKLTNLSKIYDTQALTALAVDIKITYPSKRMLTFSEPLVWVDKLIIDTEKGSETGNTLVDSIVIPLKVEE